MRAKGLHGEDPRRRHETGRVLQTKGWVGFGFDPINGGVPSGGMDWGPWSHGFEDFTRMGQ